MLDEPSLSRQWVTRRLQRALTVERWCGPARSGLSRCGGHYGRLLASHAETSQQRADRLERLIHEVGSAPYPSWGVAAPLTRASAAVVGTLSTALSARLAQIIAEHTLAEYDILEAFVEDAPGVPTGLSGDIAPMHAEAAREQAALGSSKKA